MITPPSSSVPEDEYSDSNSQINYPHPDYPVFIPNFSEDSYYTHPQELFYHYSDPENAHQSISHPPQTQTRPFSASSSSCSSTESDHPHQTPFHLQSNPYCVDAQTQHFNLNCFNNNQTHTQTQQSMYEQDYKQIHAHSTTASYTSVIVDAQQYNLANEYVH